MVVPKFTDAKRRNLQIFDNIELKQNVSTELYNKASQEIQKKKYKLPTLVTAGNIRSFRSLVKDNRRKTTKDIEGF